MTWAGLKHVPGSALLGATIGGVMSLPLAALVSISSKKAALRVVTGGAVLGAIAMADTSYRNGIDKYKMENDPEYAKKKLEEANEKSDELVEAQRKEFSKIKSGVSKKLSEYKKIEKLIQEKYNSKFKFPDIVYKYIQKEGSLVDLIKNWQNSISPEYQKFRLDCDGINFVLDSKILNFKVKSGLGNDDYLEIMMSPGQPDDCVGVRLDGTLCNVEGLKINNLKDHLSKLSEMHDIYSDPYEIKKMKELEKQYKLWLNRL